MELNVLECYDVSLVQAATERTKLLSADETCEVYNHIMIFQIYSNHYGVLANHRTAALYRSALETWLKGNAPTLKEALVIARISPVKCLSCPKFENCPEVVAHQVAAAPVRVMTSAIQ